MRLPFLFPLGENPPVLQPGLFAVLYAYIGLPMAAHRPPIAES